MSFVALVMALVVESAAPATRSMSHQALREQCLVWAADPKNPWALAHGVTAFGRTFLAADGRTADTVMVGDFLLQNGDPSLGGPFGFAKYAADGTPIEPHPNLIAKTLVLAGVPLAARYPTPFKTKVTLQQLVDSAKRSFRHVPSNAEYWKQVAWTLDLLTHTNGTSTEFDPVMTDALAELERATADLKQGLLSGAPQVDKRKQGLYAHPCGGLHFVQAVLSYASRPAIRQAWGARVESQIDILFYRLESERRQYDAARQQMPQYALEILTQQVKFYGHFLETTARLKTDLAWRPSEPQRRDIAKATALLDATVRELQELKAFERMESLKTSKPQVFLDLIGDACHASHGLDGWK